MPGKKMRARRGGVVQGLPARRVAADLLGHVLNDGMSLDLVLEKSLASGELGRLEERDRGLARLIVATTLRRLVQINAVLDAFLKVAIDARAGSVPAILSTAAAQILFLDIASHAVVNIATSLAGEDRAGRGMKGLVNAVLRRVASEGPQIIAAQDEAAMVLPDWLSQRWKKTYGAEQTRAMSRLLLLEPPLDLTLRHGEDAHAWAERMGGTVLLDGTVRIQRAGKIQALEGFGEGKWWVQDAAAALPARLLGDLHGARVVDLCAAPGGKTALLASAGAEVTAIDRDAKRMERVKENLARLGLKAETVVGDAVKWRPDEPADAVLVDAPCSATGIMRRHPDILRRRKPEHLASLVALQAKLIRAASLMVKPAGVIVYCTCSLEPEEGEQQIASALKADRSIARAGIDPASVSGFASSITPEGNLRVLPTALLEHGGNDGFFISVLKKLAANQVRQ